MKHLLGVLALALCAAFSLGQASAQDLSAANVVAGCSTPNYTYSVNTNPPTTQDPNGLQCVHEGSWLTTYSAPGGGGNGLLTATVVQIGATGARRLYGWNFANTNSADLYVQCFNLASGSVTLGSTVPAISQRIPGGGTTTNASFWEEKFDTVPRRFSTALSCAVTTTPTGSTAPANGVAANIDYQ